ncbi:hypothetical protein B484DRAFT_257601, partial [Ochromonadaceae sp. CCMP2298]
MPSSKSNNVSFMKAEPLPLGLRNVLAVSDTHICYSVTSKKNLLRVIDTLSGEKVILRGHESAVLDLQFSPADGSVLCSVDDAGGAGFDGKPHCIVWRKQGGCDWQTHASLLLPATQVVPHPQSPLVWALCDGVRVGVVDCAQGSQLTAGSYEALPLNVRLEGSQGKITDVAFSPSGTRLLVVVQPLPGGGPSLLRTYALGSSSGGGSGGMQLLGQFRPDGYVGAARWVGGYVFALSERPSVGGGQEGVIEVWGVEETSSSVPVRVQTVSITLPPFSSSQNLTNSTQGASPLYDLSLTCEPRRGRYLVLASRRAQLVAVFAVAQEGQEGQGGQGGQGPPLYHVTCLDLRAPVVSLDASTILGQEHHSAEAGEHLELSCYQEAASEGQASVQQYHVLVGQLFCAKAYAAAYQQWRNAGSPAAPAAAPTSTSIPAPISAPTSTSASASAPQRVPSPRPPAP